MTEEQLNALKHILHLAEEYCDEYRLYNANEKEIILVRDYIKEQEK